MERMSAALPEAIKSGKPIVIGSGHALSKDFLMSGAVPLWFMHAYGPQAIAIMTAPTDRQVKKVMWGELSSRYHNRLIRDKFGELQVCNLPITADWYITAFTTQETGGMVGKFQSFHSRAVCVIVSEAQAIADVIYEEIESLMTAEIVLVVILGNPLRTTGRYAKMLRDTTHNIVINLSCLESPNVIEGREVIPGVCSAKWVERMRERYRPDEPMWIAKVLGQLPSTSIDSVISAELYDFCKTNDPLRWNGRFGSIGVDPARFGDDSMVVDVMESGRPLETVIIPSCDAPTGCSHVMMALQRHFPDGQVPIVVDCDGLGGPFLDILRQMIPDKMQCQFIEFHGCSTDKDLVGDDYHNLRAEASFYAQSRMKDGSIKMDEDEWTREEAIEEKFSINLRGKIQIEDKDEIKDRLGRSPDRWDARKLAIWGFKYSQKIKRNLNDRWNTGPNSRSIAPANTSPMAV